MGFDLEISVPALTVFIQGILSFFSPCVCFKRYSSTAKLK